MFRVFAEIWGVPEGRRWGIWGGIRLDEYLANALEWRETVPVKSITILVDANIMLERYPVNVKEK